MTTENKVNFLKLSQDIASLNFALLDLTKNEEDSGIAEVSDELLQASQKLIQAQNNIMKAVNK